MTVLVLHVFDFFQLKTGGIETNLLMLVCWFAISELQKLAKPTHGDKIIGIPR